MIPRKTKILLTQNTENISLFILYLEIFFLNNTQYLNIFHFLYYTQKKNNNNTKYSITFHFSYYTQKKNFF